MSAFRVGQKVVCIDDGPTRFAVPAGFIGWRPDLDGLTKGTVYTVRNICRHPFHNYLGIRLCEIFRPCDPILGGPFEPGFYVGRFRPVAYPKQSLEHDVAQFHQISRQLPAPVKEPTT